jgi:hypothetical protein
VRPAAAVKSGRAQERMMTNNIYGDVSSMTDIRTINRKIRGEMRQVRNRAELTELKKRSDYLCTLTLSPSWRERFGRKSGRLLDVAKEEDQRTTRTANSIAHRRGLDVEYHAWGSQ